MSAIVTSSSHGPRPDGRSLRPILAIRLQSLRLRNALLLVELRHLLQGLLRGLLRSGCNLQIHIKARIATEPIREGRNEKAIAIDADIIRAID